MNFIKLLNFELNRFFKFLLLLIVIVTLTQGIGITIIAATFKHEFAETKLDAATYALQHGSFEFNYFLQSAAFSLPVLFAIFCLLAYTLVIWYREWFGKSAFIYRLLMLPTSRINVYLAKLATILLCTFSLLALQTVLIAVLRYVPSALLPDALYTVEPLAATYANDLYSFILPFTLTEFFLVYGFGTVLVVLVFTAILLERSYRWKGVLAAIGYMIAAGIMLFSPMLLTNIFYNILYPGETILLTALMGVIVIALSCLYSRYLLKYKITV